MSFPSRSNSWLIPSWPGSRSGKYSTPARRVSVIDLFAGPGGLGEGFASFKDEASQHPFHIDLSVEKEASAHKTLELRAFLRAFEQGPPKEYYQYLRGEIDRGELFSLYQPQKAQAIKETMGGPRTLGDPNSDEIIYKRLRELKGKERRIVIGGPPCQAYSVIGRVKNNSLEGYSAEGDYRHFLYVEYLKVLDELEPEVFVMENVKGILSSTVSGEPVFPKLKEELSHPTAALKKEGGHRYQIYSLVAGDGDLFGGKGTDYVIRCEEYGIPQTRHRVILLGIREDLPSYPGTLDKKESRTARDVLHDLPALRSGLSKDKDSAENWHKALLDVAEVVRREFIELGLDTSIISESLDKAREHKSRGSRFVERAHRRYLGVVPKVLLNWKLISTKVNNTRDNELTKWLLDKNLKGFINHESRGHIVKDLARYLYCSCFANLNEGTTPRVNEFPEVLAPNHKNWKSKEFADRFKVQASMNPSSTITSHIAKDGHYFIHYDPSQCRSLTVREAARLQTFPDNYLFEGSRTEQYTQVGNAVPPLLARQIAGIVYKVLP